MAITIGKQPNLLGVANNNNLFAATSNSSSRPQYKTVLDVSNFNAPNTRLQRIKQQPNISGISLFDVGIVLQDLLIDTVPMSLNPGRWRQSSTEAMRYVVRIGEEWGTSTSSSVVLTPGNTGSAGNPAVSGSNFYFVWNGAADPQDKLTPSATSYNWNTATRPYLPSPLNGSKWFPTQTTPTVTSANFNRNICLTDMPRTQSITSQELLGVSFLQGNNDATFGITGQAQDVYAYQIVWYDAANTVLGTDTQYNVTTGNGGPRASSTDTWATSIATFSDSLNGYKYQLMSVAIGPGHTQFSSWANSNWSYAIVTLYGQLNNAPNIDGTAIWDQFRLNRTYKNCDYPGIRLAWKNYYGAFDYFTFNLQLDKSNTISRESYELNPVPYSATAVPFAMDRTRRGTKQYYNTIQQNWTANSDWVDTQNANWLKELFFSTNVFYYDENYSNWLPCVVTSADVIEKTNPISQKLFNYQIQIQPALQPNPRL